jgi:hypothetical protein
MGWLEKDHGSGSLDHGKARFLADDFLFVDVCSRRTFGLFSLIYFSPSCKHRPILTLGVFIDWKETG